MKKKIAEMSNDELLKATKSLQSVTFILGGAIAIMFIIKIVSIYTLKDKSYTSFFLPIAFLPLLMINVNNLKSYKKEIRNRKIS